MKIRITATVADWFEEMTIELDTTKYKEYRLIAMGTDMIWTLDCYSKTGKGYNNRFFLAPISKEGIQKIIKKLGITDITENQYCKAS